MKTVFITITRGTLARNLLRAGLLDLLLKHEDLRVVLAIPNRIEDYFREEFKHERISLELLPFKAGTSKWRKFLVILFNGLVYTETEQRKLKYGGGNKPPVPKLEYWLKHITFSILSKFNVLKRLARYIEQSFFVERDFDYLFDTYKPDLIFCSSLYSGPDVIFIKAAKRFGVAVLSMPKSWDTVGRLFFRVPPDKFVVNNDFMTDWIVKEQLIKRENIVACGFPQFDIYKNKKIYLSKEEFCQKTGLDPSKPIVLYASEGLWTHWDEVYVTDLIDNYHILDKYNLVLRPHFSNMHEKIYHQFKHHSGVYVDDENVRLTKMFGDHWDCTRENMDWLAEVLHVSDVVVTFMTTFVLDSFVYDLPVINIFYDLPVEKKDNKPVIPMKALYNCTHYNAVLQEKPTAIAKNGNEVMESIEYFLQHPDSLSVERKKTIQKLCYKVDGKSSERIASVIEEIIYNT